MYDRSKGRDDWKTNYFWFPFSARHSRKERSRLWGGGNAIPLHGTLARLSSAPLDCDAPSWRASFFFFFKIKKPATVLNSGPIFNATIKFLSRVTRVQRTSSVIIGIEFPIKILFIPACSLHTSHPLPRSALPINRPTFFLTEGW